MISKRENSDVVVTKLESPLISAFQNFSSMLALVLLNINNFKRNLDRLSLPLYLPTYILTGTGSNVCRSQVNLSVDEKLTLNHE